MYRFAGYNPFEKSVFLRTWTEDGKRIDAEIPFKPYLYIEKEEAKDAISIFKTSLYKKTFDTSFARNDFVKKAGNKRLFHNLNPEQQFLLETFQDKTKKQEFSKFPLKVFFLDIETASFGAFPDPNNPKDPINLITVYDSLTNITHTWGLQNEYIPTKEGIKYYCCESEKDLLLRFIDFWKLDYPDICSGWNSFGFDIPYILNRCIFLFDEDFIKQLSPIRRVTNRTIFSNIFNKEMIKWSISGVGCIDYLEIYKTFSIGERESYSLNYISEFELKEGKITHNATSLAALSQTDWSTFVDYNIQDVHLLVKLEEKLKYLQIVRLLAYKGYTNFEAALGKVAIVTGAVAAQAHKQGLVIPTFENRIERTSYEGGYVKEPERGLQKAVVSFDVNSLYPNTIITLNISPETKIGKVVSGDIELNEELTIKLVNGNMYNISSEKFRSFLRKEQISLSKAGVLYSQKTKGVIPNLIDQIYKERVEAKQELQQLKRSKKKDKDIILKLEYLNNLQYTLKIYLNSIYGTFANRHSFLMDIDNAASITLSGQSVAKAGGQIIDQHVRDNYDINESIVKYGDTDSIYISINSILNKRKLQLTEDSKITQEAYNVVDKIDKHVNEEILNWARKELFSIDPRYIFKREVIADIALFIQKKRYILHILDEEGTTTNKFKYVGVELVRATTPKKVKKYIEKITNTALLSQDIKETNKIYRESYEKFCSLPVDDVALRSTVNNLNKYAKKNVSLQQFDKGTPSHVKGAIAYNLLLDSFNIENKFEKIQTGQKIKKIYCAKNKYGLDAISYPSILPPDFNLQIDWERMFHKLVTKPITTLYQTIGWSLPVLNKEIQTDLFELFS